MRKGIWMDILLDGTVSLMAVPRGLFPRSLGS